VGGYAQAMGYIRHHGMIVTSYDEERIEAAHEKARDIGMTVTEVVESPVNGYRSFCVAPDGSKEGWDASEKGDAQRDELVSWLESKSFEDGSAPYDWAEVQYGDEMGDNELLRSEADKYRACV